MPADLPSLIVAAESATAEQEIDCLIDAVRAVCAAGLITRFVEIDALSVIDGVRRGDLPRSCLLGAALLLVPEGHSWFVSNHERDIAHAQVWKASQLAAIGNHASPAVALTIASLRALQAAAGATEAGR